MAEYGAIPCRLNGLEIPDVSDVGITESRNVIQNATSGGVKITYGVSKWQATITFKTMADRLAFMRLVGVGQKNPTPHNFGYTLGGQASFSLLNGVPSGTQKQTDQDGTATLQFTAMYETFKDEN